MLPSPVWMEELFAHDILGCSQVSSFGNEDGAHLLISKKKKKDKSVFNTFSYLSFPFETPPPHFYQEKPTRYSAIVWTRRRSSEK